MLQKIATEFWCINNLPQKTKWWPGKISKKISKKYLTAPSSLNN
jgi:hypothetical protein